MLPTGDIKSILVLRLVYVTVGILLTLLTAVGGAAVFIWKDLTGKVQKLSGELAKAQLTISELKSELEVQKRQNERMKKYLRLCILGGTDSLLVAPNINKATPEIENWIKDLEEFEKQTGVKVSIPFKAGGQPPRIRNARLDFR
jgi:hypothetical protein